MNNDDICAIVLAGGQSRRMGFNKALISIGGQPLIGIVIDQIRPLTDQILVSSNDCMSYQFLNYPVIADCYEGLGPLAGFHAGMLQKNCPIYIVVACDLPNLKTPLLRKMVLLAKGYDAAIPRTRDGVIHPLCAVYRRTCLPFIEKALLKGASKVIETFLNDSLKIKWISQDEGQFGETDLANINTPEDLRQFQGKTASNAAANSICSSPFEKDPDIL